MEFIIKQGNSTLNLNSRKPLRTVTKAEHRQGLLSEDVVSLSVESKAPISFYVGDVLEYSNRRYSLNSAPKVKKEQGFYTYDLTFEGTQYLLRDKVFFNRDAQGVQTTADFPLTGELQTFLTVLLHNITALGGMAWQLGEMPQNTETKTLTFNNENCLAVLQRLCQEYDTEFEIQQNLSAKTCTLHLRKIGKVRNETFAYGKGNGLYSLNRENANENIITRLYVLGSTENISSDYRDYSPRLRLPVSYGKDYIQDDAKVALFGLKEGIKTFDDIRPTFKGIISGVQDLPNGSQEIVVSNMDFDLNEKDSHGNKYLLNDTPAKIHINKGNLAGYAFELLKNGGYNHATKTFKVKPFTDERGQKFPDTSTIFKFAVGDELTLLDIAMPPQYITNAENKLLAEGQKEYEKLSINNLKYTLDLDPLFLKQNSTEAFAIGDYIRVVDAPLNVDKTSRITNITRDLLEEYSYKLSIADTYEVSFIASMIAEINDTKKLIKTEKQINRQNYLSGYRQQQELREHIFDTEGYFDPQHIKPASIDTNMLTVGAKSQQFALENVTLNPNIQGNPAKLAITGGRLVHFSLEPQVREWTLSPYTHNSLLNQLYYVYAKCSRGSHTAQWYVTTEKIPFDSRSNDYYFLCFVLYTPQDGKRDAEAMYGNVTLHGGQISAGRIKSTNGQTFFDLDSGEISGRISFSNDSPALQQAVDAVQVGGRNLLENSANIKKALNETKFGHNQFWRVDITHIDKKIEIGDTITISFDVQMEQGHILRIYDTNDSKRKFFGLHTFTNIGNTKRRISCEFTVTANGKNKSFHNLDFYNDNNGDKFTIENIKIEKGNKATDWTPAPEDVETEIQTAESNAKAHAQSLVDSIQFIGANLVRNPTETGNSSGWTNTPIETVSYDGSQVKALRLQTSGDAIIYSDWFDIDPTRAYEVSVCYKKNVVNGRNYIGIDTEGGTPYDINGETGAMRLNGNFYFTHFTSDITGNWVKLRGYILPYAYDPENTLGLSNNIGGINHHARLKPTNTRVRLRILNYYNNGVNSKLWIVNPQCREVSPEVLETISKSYKEGKAAKEQVQAQQNNINSLLAKTNFLSSTSVQGNAVATGSVIVGNGYGANAGLTGLGGSSDMFLWGGTDFNNRGNAPISIHRDGFLRVRNGAGQVIFEIGQRDGKAVFNIFNDNGTKVAEIGQSGLNFIGYISDSFSATQLWRLGVQNGNPSEMKNNVFYALRKRRLERSPRDINEEKNGTFAVESPVNTTAYLYNAGNNFETQANKQYEDIFFASENKLGAKIQNGWYIMRYRTIFNIQNGQNMWQPDGLCPIGIDIVYIYDGKVMNQQTVKAETRLNIQSIMWAYDM